MVSESSQQHTIALTALAARLAELHHSMSLQVLLPDAALSKVPLIFASALDPPLTPMAPARANRA